MGGSNPQLDSNCVAELSEVEKMEIVTRLARYEAPADIAKELEQRGIDCDKRQVGGYDPTRPYFEAGDKWRDVFAAARKAYLEDVGAVPVANQGYRLQILQQGIEAAQKAKNWPLVSRLIEQASKEVGGAFTNQRDVSINDSRTPKAKDASPEDRREMLSDLLRTVIQNMTVPPGTDPQHQTSQ